MKHALVIALALVACKKKVTVESDQAVANRYKNAICACKDYACAQKVAAVEIRRINPDAVRVPEVAASYQAAATCLRKLEATRTPYETQPVVPPTVTADSLVRAAREWINAKYPGTFIYTLRVDYVEANGMLEPDFGEIYFVFGAPQTVVDDPQRKTGVPAPRDAKVVTVCPGARWLISDRWHTWQGKCLDMPEYVQKCSVEAIWKRAIAAGAPTDAVAKISFQHDRDPPWAFEIVDEPRKINIVHRFADDCELVVEQP